MTWAVDQAWCFEHSDATMINRFYGQHVTRQNVAVKSGAFGGLIDYSSGGVGRGLGFDDMRVGGYLRALTFWARLTAAPSAAANLLQQETTNTIFSRINADRTITMLDKMAVVLGTSSKQLPTAGATMQVGMFWVQYPPHIFDGDVYVYLFMDEEFQFGAKTTYTQAQFWAAAWPVFLGRTVAQTLGMNLYIDDVVYRTSGDMADAPTVTPYPLLFCNGQGQTDEDDTIEWDTPAAPAAHYPEIDDPAAGNHDADATYIETGTVNEDDLFTCGDANPVPGGKTIVCVIPECISRLVGDSKAGAIFLVNRSGETPIEGDPATPIVTTYRWMASPHIARPGGGAWVQGDFDADDLIYGARSAASGTPAPRITLMPHPTIVWEDGFLPPALFGPQRERGFERGVGRGILKGVA